MADEETIKLEVANQMAGFAIGYLVYMSQGQVPPEYFEQYRDMLTTMSYGA